MIKRTFAAIAVSTLIAVPSAFAQQTDAPPAKVDNAAQVDKASAATNLAFRASDLMDLEVRNAADEDVASVEDLVIDVKTGKVRYVAVSYGGFAGVGDKLFAIPMNRFTVKKDADDDTYYLWTTLTAEKLKNAPGFDEDNWPAMASQTQWTQQVDKYYGADDADVVEEDDEVTPRR